jgi:hypothetical protein
MKYLRVYYLLFTLVALLAIFAPLITALYILIRALRTPISISPPDPSKPSTPVPGDEEIPKEDDGDRGGPSIQDLVMIILGIIGALILLMAMSYLLFKIRWNVKLPELWKKPKGPGSGPGSNSRDGMAGDLNRLTSGMTPGEAEKAKEIIEGAAALRIVQTNRVIVEQKNPISIKTGANNPTQPVNADNQKNSKSTRFKIPQGLKVKVGKKKAALAFAVVLGFLGWTSRAGLRGVEKVREVDGTVNTPPISLIENPFMDAPKDSTTNFETTGVKNNIHDFKRDLARIREFEKPGVRPDFMTELDDIFFVINDKIDKNSTFDQKRDIVKILLYDDLRPDHSGLTRTFYDTVIDNEVTQRLYPTDAEAIKVASERLAIMQRFLGEVTVRKILNHEPNAFDADTKELFDKAERVAATLIGQGKKTDVIDVIAEMHELVPEPHVGIFDPKMPFAAFVVATGLILYAPHLSPLYISYGAAFLQTQAAILDEHVPNAIEQLAISMRSITTHIASGNTIAALEMPPVMLQLISQMEEAVKHKTIETITNSVAKGLHQMSSYVSPLRLGDKESKYLEVMFNMFDVPVGEKMEILGALQQKGFSLEKERSIYKYMIQFKGEPPFNKFFEKYFGNESRTKLAHLKFLLDKRPELFEPQSSGHIVIQKSKELWGKLNVPASAFELSRYYNGRLPFYIQVRDAVAVLRHYQNNADVLPLRFAIMKIDEATKAALISTSQKIVDLVSTQADINRFLLNDAEFYTSSLEHLGQNTVEVTS